MSAAMPSRQQRARSERRQHEAKMAAGTHTNTLLEAAQQGTSRGGIDPVPPHSPSKSNAEQDTRRLPDPPPSTVQAADSPVTYADMVRAVQDAIAPMLEKQTAQLQQAVADLKGQLHQLSHKVQSTENRLGETFQDVFTLKERFAALQKSHHQMCNKVDDLENRSRRCNLRIIGLPETVKGPDLFTFLQETLPDLLQIQEACSGLVVERAHRLGPVRSPSEGRPRVVIFKSLSFVHKEAIWQASRQQKDLRWNGARLHIFQDYSAEVTRARKEFTPICSRLVKENRKFALLFPARLRIYDGNSFKEFTVVKDALGYLREQQEESTGDPLSTEGPASPT